MGPKLFSCAHKSLWWSRGQIWKLHIFSVMPHSPENLFLHGKLSIFRRLVINNRQLALQSIWYTTMSFHGLLEVLSENQKFWKEGGWRPWGKIEFLSPPLLSVKRAFVMLSGSRAIGTCVTLIYICRDVTSAHILTQIFQFANHGVQLHFLYSISIVFHLWSQSISVVVHSVHTRVLYQP